MTLPPCVDAEEPKENEHVERHGQRDEREDHPSVRAHPKYTRVVHRLEQKVAKRPGKKPVINENVTHASKRHRRRVSGRPNLTKQH